jgi:hypothetical protein
LILRSAVRSAVCRQNILYAYTVYAAVRLLYRDGVQTKPQAPLVGQLNTSEHKRVPLLNLWPLPWVEHDNRDLVPLAVLWHPVLLVVRHGSMTLRGFEAVERGGGSRRWAAQKWLCDVMDLAQAQNFIRPDPQIGELKPWAGYASPQ